MRDHDRPSYGAIPTIYKNIRFRSRLEAKVACFLDENRVQWDYEPFELEGCYIPDFHVVLGFGSCLIECKPATLHTDFVEPCAKITRSGWRGPAIVVGSILAPAPDDLSDLFMYGSLASEEGGWSRVGRGRWPAPWGEYPFEDVWTSWTNAGNSVQWRGPSVVP